MFVKTFVNMNEKGYLKTINQILNVISKMIKCAGQTLINKEGIGSLIKRQIGQRASSKIDKLLSLNRSMFLLR